MNINILDNQLSGYCSSQLSYDLFMYIFFWSLCECTIFFRLAAKVALITGGAYGIFALLFHKLGAKICLVDVLDNLGKQVCESQYGDSNACLVHCDVRVEEDVSQGYHCCQVWHSRYHNQQCWNWWFKIGTRIWHPRYQKMNASETKA